MKDGFGPAGAAALWTALVFFILVYALPGLTLLVGYSILLAYVLLPIVRAVRRIRGPGGWSVPRPLAAGVLMLALFTLVIWSAVLGIPRLGAEAARFANHAPAVLDTLVGRLHGYAADHELSRPLDPAIESLRGSLLALVRNLGGLLLQGAGFVLHSVGQILGLLLLPLLTFYLLAEADAIRESALRFVPAAAHPRIVRLARALDRGMRSYVRGQAIVCLTMGIAVGAALGMIGLPGVLLIGILAGAAELVPYIGFTVAFLAILLAGLSVDPWHAAAGVLTYTAINWAIGALVTPRVMGRYLRLHPFIVTISVLAGASLLGPGGALLALPAAAVLQSVMEEFAVPLVRGPETPAEPPAPATGVTGASSIVTGSPEIRRRADPRLRRGVAPLLLKRSRGARPAPIRVPFDQA